MSDKESLNDKKRISEKRELSHSELKTIERFNKKRTLEPVSEWAASEDIIAAPTI